ncbi:MAG: hypothetical protein LBQ12_14045 [Deltaproteobacteria bacterium]|jgi:hypothetical protein|nr:hypothetical protein [Deltaproteobacteria bacterium]
MGEKNPQKGAPTDDPPHRKHDGRPAEAACKTDEAIKAFYDWLYPDGDLPELPGAPALIGGPVYVRSGAAGSKSVIAAVRANGSDVARVLELLDVDPSDVIALPGAPGRRESNPAISVAELGEIAVGMAERGRKAELNRAMELLEGWSAIAGDTSVLDRVRGRCQIAFEPTSAGPGK